MTVTTTSTARLVWLYPVALALTVTLASGRGQVAGPGFSGSDKIAHFCVFGLLASLVARSPGATGRWVPVLIVSTFGALDEFRQSFTPGRSVEFADWAADTCGALVAVLLYRGWPIYRLLLERPLRVRPASESKALAGHLGANPATLSR